MEEYPSLDLQSDDALTADQIMPLVYTELRELAGKRLAQEPPGQTLQATALVHEAYMRLVKNAKDQTWDSKGHFFSAAAEAMRRILVEKARKKKSKKHGGHRTRIGLSDADPAVDSDSDIDLIALDHALTKLHEIEPRKASLVNLRYFAGLTQSEAAKVLGVSVSTADSDWAYARVWLKVELADASDGD